MNMISTGAFLTEVDTHNKKDALVSKLVSAWEKKNSRSAKAGGVSLMALSLAACGSSDDTDAVSYSQAQYDLAKTTATSDATTAALKDAGGVAHATVDAAITSNDATVTTTATSAALKAANGTTYATVDAAFTAGSSQSNSDAIAAALKDAGGVAHSNVDVAITSNDAAITTAATNAAEALLVTGSGFATVSALLAAYQSATGAPTPSSTTLTSSSNVVTGFTTGADTISATSGTYNTGDVMVDPNSADGDTLTVAATASVTATPVVMGIENVAFNYTMFTEPSTALTNIKDGTITITQAQVGASTAATATAAGSVTLTAGSGVTGTLTVTQSDGSTLIIDAGSASTIGHSEVGDTLASSVTVNGSAASSSLTVDGGDQGTVVVNGTATDRIISATGKNLTVDSKFVGTATSGTTDSEITIVGENNSDDTASITLAGVVTLVGSAAVETTTLTATQASTVTLTTGIGTVLDLAGSNDINLTSTKAVVNAEKITSSGTGAYTVRVTDDLAGAIDASKFDADMTLRLDDFDDTDTVTIDSGGTIDYRQSTSQVLELVSSGAANTTGESISIVANVAAPEVTNGTAGDGTGADRFETINLSSSLIATSVVLIAGTDTAVNLSGSKSITLGGASTASKVTNNGVTAVYNYDGTSDPTIVGSATSSDTINILLSGIDISADTFSDIDIILAQIDGAGNNATDDMSLVIAASQVNGKTISMIGDVEDTGSTKDDITITADGSTINLGSLVIDSATFSDVTINLNSVKALASTITGSNIVDNLSNTGAGAITIDGKAGADVIATGSGADVITGGTGADTITGGAGADTIILTEASAAVDTVVYTGGIATMDTVTGFTAGATNGDNLDISLADMNSLASVASMNTGDATALATATGMTLTTVDVGAYDLGSANSDVLVLNSNFADTSAVETALEVGGSMALTVDGTLTAKDGMLIMYDDGVSSFLARWVSTAGASDNATLVAGDLTVTNMVKFSDIADVTDFVSANIDVVT